MKIGVRTKRRMIKVLIMRIYQNSGNDEHENDNENNDDMIGNIYKKKHNYNRRRTKITIIIIKTKICMPWIIFVTV